MKKLYSFMIFALVFTTVKAQTNLAQWNFNGTSSSAVSGGELAPTPSSGTGTASIVGTITTTFSSGVSSGGSSDPVTTSPDNFGWNTTTYASSGTENKGRGVQFNVSTVGHQGISFTFDQRLSNTAANTWVLQYTTDATTWIDATTFTFTPAATGTGDTWYNGRTFDLSSVTALDDNANAAFRIVAAFDPTTNDYLAARSTSSYGTGGTSRFDMVTVTASSTLSAADFSKNSLTMYPNPAVDYVNFSENVSLEVYDVSGKLVLSASQVENLNVSQLKSGIYFVNINNEETKKLVIN